MHVGCHTMLRQARAGAMHWAAVNGENWAAGVGLLHQRRDPPADTGDAGHLRKSGAVEANRQGVGQLRDVRATGA